jgi:metal-sulfur cluster biosynthetic enzyme
MLLSNKDDAMATKGEILDALRGVIDPEIGLNIVDVGLVYRVEQKGGVVEVDYTLTYPGCPLGDVIKEDIVRVVSEATDADTVEARLVWDPPWTIDFMSEEARLEMGYPI